MPEVERDSIGASLLTPQPAMLVPETLGVAPVPTSKKTIFLSLLTRVKVMERRKEDDGERTLLVF